MNKERKILLIAACLLLPAALVYRFYPEDIQFNLFQNSQVAVKRKMLQKYRSLIKGQALIQTRFDSLNRLLAQAETGLLRGGTPMLAAVDLQNTLTDITRAADIQVTSTRVMASKDSPEEGYLMEIPVRITLNADVAQLTSFLFNIENSSKILTVTRLRARVVDLRKPDVFQVDATVAGYMKRNGVNEIS